MMIGHDVCVPPRVIRRRGPESWRQSRSFDSVSRKPFAGLGQFIPGFLFCEDSFGNVYRGEEIFRLTVLRVPSLPRYQKIDLLRPDEL